MWEVRQAVAELPADEQEMVRLQHLDGLTHDQIAERLGVAVGTVKSRSFRAHKRLASRARTPTGMNRIGVTTVCKDREAQP